jgi:hypothetical protein
MLEEEFAPPTSRLSLRRTRWRDRLLSRKVGALATVSLAVIFLGCMSLSFGERTVVETHPEHDVLTQEGSVSVLEGEVREVYYPIPYASPPNLDVRDCFHDCMILDQKPESFRVRNPTHSSIEVKWKARGVRCVVPASTLPPPPGLPPTPVPVVPQPAPEPKS